MTINDNDNDNSDVNFFALTNENRSYVLRATAAAWHQRCAELNLKPGTKGRLRELEAFLQAALVVLTATRVMNLDTAGMIAMLVYSGRGESVIENWSRQ